MQLSEPNDFIIGSGNAYSVEEFVKIAFNLVNLDYRKYLKINESLLRPSKTTTLIGDISKAKKMFDFKNENSLTSLIKLMLTNDLIENGLNPQDYLND
jgi:GDPmannose 4,6-dehydratase